MGARTLAVLLFSCFLFFSSVNAWGRQLAASDDSTRLENLVLAGRKLQVALDPKVPATLLEAIKIGKRHNGKWYSVQLAQALNTLASYYAFKGKHDSALFYTRQLEQISLSRKDAYGMAKANMAYGLIADYQADYETAIRRNLQALHYLETVKDSTGIIPVKGNLANSYIRLKQYGKAIPLLDEVITFSHQKNDRRSEANNLSSLARAYKGSGNRKKELELKLKALALFKAEGYKKGIATVAGNLAVYYETDKDFGKALYYYHTAIRNSREINDKGNIAIFFNNVSDLYLKLGKTDSAVFFNDSASVYSKRSGDLLSQSDALLYRSNILRSEGRHSEADEAQDAYLQLKDSIYSNNLQSKVADMEVKYETGKKQQQIELLDGANKTKALLLARQRQDLQISELRLEQNDRELAYRQLDGERKQQDIRSLRKQALIHDLTLKNSRLQLKERNLAIGGLLLLGLAGLMTGRLAYMRNQAKQRLAAREALQRQEEIATRALFEGEQQERIRLAMELHDGIGQQLAVIKMRVSNLPDNPVPGATLDGALELVDSTIDEVRAISHGLIPEGLNFGLFPALENLCEKLRSASRMLVSCSFPDNLRYHKFGKGRELSIYRIVQEIMSNMTKHSGATEASLEVEQFAQVIRISIRDNGRGLDASAIAKSTGLGWKNITARVAMLEGKLQVSPAKPAGTQIDIDIPDK